MKISLRTLVRVIVTFVFLQAVPADASQEKPMRFSTYWPCDGNASFCGVRILAQGVIQANSGREFLKFLSNTSAHAHELPPVPTVVFDSPGGSVVGALALGRAIRDNKINTELGINYSRIRQSAREEEVFVTSVVCASACALAFAGGVERKISPSARVGVHQFSASNGSIGDGATQVTLTAIATYLDLMGVKRSLLDRASLVEPASMYWLTDAEAKRYRLDNTRNELTPWNVSATRQGLPVLTVWQSLSDGRYAVITLMLNQDSLAMGVSLILEKSLYRDERISQFPNGQPAQISLCGDSGCHRATPVQGWSKIETGAQTKFQAIAVLPASSLRTLANSTALSIDDGFPRPLSDVSISTDLSVVGFGSGAALLLRNKQ